jgi:hypothetical protein
MNDQNQNSAIRLQSSAIVVAALITGSGAVIAACIQTGLIGRPFDPPLAVSMLEPTPKPAQATFTGTIEPLADNRPLEMHQAAPTTVSKVVLEPASAFSATTYSTPMYSAAPALLPTDESAKPETATRTLVSPWAYLKSATPVDTQAGSSNSKKNPFSWNSVTRYFRGNN